jgi:hypothetical protein
VQGRGVSVEEKVEHHRGGSEARAIQGVAESGRGVGVSRHSRRVDCVKIAYDAP